ncbi:hypothetical protein GDO81_004265 [Engystomops pustulosus]|uniref:Uncharacterized protein n=1 Tax=Engystomops pustulosus TaxID=76066 RepID=A0AAV6ZTK3_ENGPU|nr:hypothetical protein GDO81_004265 [Engystomops pustulosus]
MNIHYLDSYFESSVNIWLHIILRMFTESVSTRTSLHRARTPLPLHYTFQALLHSSSSLPLPAQYTVNFYPVHLLHLSPVRFPRQSQHKENRTCFSC